MALTGDNDADLQNPLWGDGWRDIRALFPMEPGYAHLNNGSFGAAPVPVLEAQAEWRSRADANTTRFYRREIQPALEEARLATSEFLGAGSAGLTLVANVTTGIAAVLGTVPLEPGDEILATDHNYLATLMAVARTCEETGARLVTVAIPLTASEDEITEAILSGVTDRTRLAVIDHITSATARRFPVERIVPALQERGVAVCVDAAHTPGMLPVDLESLAPDFWTGNLHKWAYAPRAAAPLYASAKWRETMRPLIVSGGPRRASRTPSSSTARRISARFSRHRPASGSSPTWEPTRCVPTTRGSPRTARRSLPTPSESTRPRCPRTTGWRCASCRSRWT